MRRGKDAKIGTENVHRSKFSIPGGPCQGRKKSTAATNAVIARQKALSHRRRNETGRCSIPFKIIFVQKWNQVGVINTHVKCRLGIGTLNRTKSTVETNWVEG